MKRSTLEQAIARTNELAARIATRHEGAPAINGRSLTLGKLWDVLGKRWTWCERFEPTGSAMPYRVEGKWLFEPVYQVGTLLKHRRIAMASYIITSHAFGSSASLEDIIGTVEATSAKRATASVPGNVGRVLTAHNYDKAPEVWKVRADKIGAAK